MGHDLGEVKHLSARRAAEHRAPVHQQAKRDRLCRMERIVTPHRVAIARPGYVVEMAVDDDDRRAGEPRRSIGE